MRCVVVAGARPNFMKVAPIIAELSARKHGAVLVHTGQHYDPQMSGAFFRDLNLNEPDYDLGVGSGSHAQQTARVMEAFEPVLLEVKPDWVVVVGDVNSTLACALVASKLAPDINCRVAHVEAGLRSRDWRMPEEVNRVLTDRLSDLLLTPSSDAAENLLAEGIDPERIEFVGNVMIDSLYAHIAHAAEKDLPSRLGVRRDAYVIATIHRPSNVDDKSALASILEALSSIAREAEVVFPIHPRTKRSVERFGLGEMLAKFSVVEPLGYVEMLSLVQGASVVLTDSGGLQEETTVMGVPCVTLRGSTERPVTVVEGTNRLAPWPLTVDGILRTYRDASLAGKLSLGSRVPAGWDGRAASRIVAALERRT